MRRFSWDSDVQYIGSCRIPNGTLGGISDAFGYSQCAAALDGSTLWLASQYPGDYVGRFTLPISSLNTSYDYTLLPYATFEEMFTLPAEFNPYDVNGTVLLGLQCYGATHLIGNMAYNYSELNTAPHMFLLAIDHTSPNYPSGGMWRVGNINMHRAAGNMCKHPASVAAVLGRQYQTGLGYTISRTGSYGNEGACGYGFDIDTAVIAGGSQAASTYLQYDSLTEKHMPIGWAGEYRTENSLGYESNVLSSHLGRATPVSSSGASCLLAGVFTGQGFTTYRGGIGTNFCGVSQNGPWSTFYDSFLVLYSIDDLAAVAAGYIQPQKLMWYERVHVPPLLLMTRYKTTPSCDMWCMDAVHFKLGRYIWSIAADENRIAIIENMTWYPPFGVSPAVHLFDIL